jgi:hypothetical protein
MACTIRRYPRNVLFSLNKWLKSRPLSLSTTQPPLTSTTFNNIKSLGLLRKMRGTRSLSKINTLSTTRKASFFSNGNLTYFFSSPDNIPVIISSSRRKYIQLKQSTQLQNFLAPIDLDGISNIDDNSDERNLNNFQTLSSTQVQNADKLITIRTVNLHIQAPLRVMTIHLECNLHYGMRTR